MPVELLLDTECTFNGTILRRSSPERYPRHSERAMNGILFQLHTKRHTFFLGGCRHARVFTGFLLAGRPFENQVMVRRAKIEPALFVSRPKVDRCSGTTLGGEEQRLAFEDHVLLVDGRILL